MTRGEQRAIAHEAAVAAGVRRTREAREQDRARIASDPSRWPYGTVGGALAYLAGSDSILALSASLGIPVLEPGEVRAWCARQRRRSMG